jgi:hypothetical protein
MAVKSITIDIVQKHLDQTGAGGNVATPNEI